MKKIYSIKSVFILVLAVAFTFAPGKSSLFAQYCIPSYGIGCTSGDQIQDVIMPAVGIEHIGTGCSPAGYGDFTADPNLQGLLIPGETYSFTINNGPTWSQGIAIYIDFEGNQSFLDPGNLVATSPSALSHTGTFTVPITATPGTTRMRILCQFAAIPAGPCPVGITFGETHDYTVTIAPAVDCSVICPNDIVVNNDPGQCGANVSIPLPTLDGTECDGLDAPVNDFNGSPNASGFYPVGETTVTYTIPGTSATPCSFSVEVIDAEAPVLNCPSDIIITLSPGECERIVDYTVTASDNCPFSQGVDPLVQNILQPPPNGWDGIMVNIENISASPISVEEMVFTGALLGAPAGPYTFQLYMKLETYVGFEANAGAWTLVSEASPNLVGFPTTNDAVLTLTTPFEIPAGEVAGVYVVVLGAPGGGARVMAELGAAPTSDGNLSINNPGNWISGTFGGVIFPGEQPRPEMTVSYSIGGGGDIVQIEGLPSGSIFPVGTVTNCFEVEDGAGNVGDCCFDVTVNPFPNPVTALACNNLVNISLDQNCEALINADMILEGGPYGCYDDYELVIETQGGVSVPNPITGDFIGELLMVTVIDPATGNSCWSNIFIEDKIKPTIECRDLILDCGDEVPNEPAPGVEGAQSIIFDGLNDEFNAGAGMGLLTYEFDFGYLPADATIEDVRVPMLVTSGTAWLSDISIRVTSPNGTTVNVLAGLGCAGGGWTLNATFDDAGPAVVGCAVDVGGGPLQPIGGSLGTFEGELAQGIWTIELEHVFFFENGFVNTAGLILDVDADPIAPSDNCGDIDVSFTEVITPGSCASEFAETILRTWVVVDGSGNSAECTQVININRTDLEEFEFPGTVELDCADFPVGTVPGPDFTGGPGDLLCGDFVSTFTDIIIPDCGGARKILRTWTIIDWCTGEIFTGDQIIKIKDGDGPEFDLACEAPRTINTDLNSCERLLYFVPVPEITDECSDVVTYTVSSTAGNVSLDNQGRWIIENLPVGTHTVTYTANDGCDNITTCSFELNVVDNVAPVAICDIDTRVSLGSDGNALVHWTAFDDGSYDNCGIAEIGLQRDLSNPGGRAGCGNSPGANVWVPQLNFCCDDLTRSPILVNVRVVDVNGNTNVCQVEVYVEDRLAPVVSCPDPIEVDLNCLYNFGEVVWGEAIGNDNAANVSADALNNIALFGEQFGRIARTQSPFNEEFRSFEINPTGNPNSQVRIGINDGYAVDNCPTSGAGLRVFETYRITVDPMCGNVGTSVSQLNPFKGNLAIERNFYVVDGQGNGQAAPNAGFGNPNTATCTQRIYVTNSNPFQGLTRMQWENNALGQANIIRTINECGGDDPDLHEVGEIDKARILNYINNRADAACANLLVGYTDMEFQIVPDACFKVLRQWKVIDWCQHDPNSGAGEWTYIQQIKVMDTAGPECDGCGERDFEIDNGANCEGFVDFEVEFFDGCTPDDQLHIRFQVDAFNTGSFDIDQSWTGAANAVNANRTLPFGDHRVRWTVSDMCGNVSIFEYEFSVVDAKQPTPVCLNGISTVVMPATIPPMITLSADHFDAGSFDDCTDSENLIFSYTSDTDDTHWTWSCDDLDGEQIVTFPVTIWVTDEAGNQDFCETYIEIQDNMNVCPADTASGSATIAGLVTNEENVGVDNVDVTLLGINSALSAGFNTGVDGSFTFANVPMAHEYTLEGSRNDNPLNGVTTYDIALIQRHILGSQLLDSPYKLIAADVNNDGNINVIDVAQLRRLILGTYSEFPNSESWKIIVDEPLETGITPPAHNTVMDLGLVNRDMFENNFIAIKMGDVNASHNANGLISASERTSGESLQFVAQDVNLTSGEQVVVEITSDNIEGVFGYQGTINFDRNALEFVGFESGLIELSDANFGFHLLSEGMITTSWSETTGIENGNGVLFSLVFEARSEGTLSQALSIGSNRTVAESYNDNGVMGVEMVFESRAVRADNFTLYQNTPNPFNGETVIGFVLPEATEATITIFDVTGKVVRVIEGNYAAGYNEETVSRSELGAAGVYYYQLDTENHTATKKMIFMD